MSRDSWAPITIRSTVPNLEMWWELSVTKQKWVPRLETRTWLGAHRPCACMHAVRNRKVELQNSHTVRKRWAKVLNSGLDKTSKADRRKSCFGVGIWSLLRVTVGHPEFAQMISKKLQGSTKGQRQCRKYTDGWWISRALVGPDEHQRSEQPELSLPTSIRHNPVR